MTEDLWDRKDVLAGFFPRSQCWIRLIECILVHSLKEVSTSRVPAEAASRQESRHKDSRAANSDRNAAYPAVYGKSPQPARTASAYELHSLISDQGGDVNGGYTPHVGRHDDAPSHQPRSYFTEGWQDERSSYGLVVT